MFSAATAAPLTRSGPRPLPIVISVLVHAVVLGFVHFSPRAAVARQPRSLYDAVIRPHEHELVWYSFSRQLPEVSPRVNHNSTPHATELESREQTIISNPQQAERGRQMIWRPAPQIKPQAEIVSPNILAFQRPLLPLPPPGPPPKLFIPPPAVRRSQPPATLPPAPPPVQQARIAPKPNPLLMADLSVALANRPKTRDFVPPVLRSEKRTAPLALPEAPSIATSLRSGRVPLLAENMAAPLADKPPLRRFVPPPTPGRPATSPAPLPDAPKFATRLASASVPSNAALQSASAAALANKPEPRKFVPPHTEKNAAGAGNASPPIEEAPSLDLAGLPSASVNVAIVGLHPAPVLKAPLPESSRDARFSAGPISDGTQGAVDPASHATLSVPGLAVRGSPPRSADDPLYLARLAPTSREMLAAAMKAVDGAPRSDQAPAEIRLAPPPESEFNGRDVYTLAVQMPNISSYVGSWIMWFADREQTPGGSRGLHPPVPLHKVDPKYLPAAIAERIEGKVQIAGVVRTNGRVDLLRILKGVDPRLDRCAEEALLKWEFVPAERNGVPVEVDLVAEIPFLLAPQAKR
jgi:TonB family protein